MAPTRNMRRVNKYGPYFNAARRTGAYLATRATQGLGDRIQRYFRGGNRSGVVTTTQHDYRTQYRKKKMPRYKKRRWLKFQKKVRAVSEKETGTTTVVRNATLDTQTASSGTQQYQTPTLYGMNGTNFTSSAGNDDIAIILQADNRLTANGKMKFTSAVMDITFRNVAVSEVNPGSDMELDLYEVMYYDQTKETNAHAIFEQAELATPILAPTSGTNANLTMLSRGATPFDFPLAIKAGKIQIMKKTKVFLAIGNTTTYQFRDPRTHIVGYNEWSDTTGFVKRKVTRGLIAVFKPVVGSANACRLLAGTTRTYRYHVIQDNKTFDALRA